MYTKNCMLEKAAWWNREITAVVQRKKEAYLGILEGSISQDEFQDSEM